jgi:hypothetical protein
MSFDLVLTGAAGLAPAGVPLAGAPWIQRALALDAGPRWRAIAEALLAQPELWQDAGCVLVLADDVEIGATAVSELFRVMRTCGLRVAQPSLAWRSHFADPTTLHNPCFVYRHANRVDTAAIAFSADALRDCLPLLRDAPDAALLARLLPAGQDEPLRGAAVVDAVQALRTAPAAAEEFAEPAWPEILQGDGPHREAGFSWGGLGLRGQYTSLFDTTRDEFLGALTAGYACAVQDAQAIGEVFLQHFSRSLEAAPQPLVPRAPAPRLRRSPILDHRTTA